MYIDLPPNDNLGQGAMATFAENGPTRELSRIRLWQAGSWHWCAITGWQESGPVPARILPIEESGDGPALLVIGGGWGLRLAALADPGDSSPSWDLEDASQWAEPFLICRPDIQFR